MPRLVVEVLLVSAGLQVDGVTRYHYETQRTRGRWVPIGAGIAADSSSLASVAGAVAVAGAR